jgi:hypothetical protein
LTRFRRLYAEFYRPICRVPQAVRTPDFACCNARFRFIPDIILGSKDANALRDAGNMYRIQILKVSSWRIILTSEVHSTIQCFRHNENECVNMLFCKLFIVYCKDSYLWVRLELLSSFPGGWWSYLKVLVTTRAKDASRFDAYEKVSTTGSLFGTQEKMVAGLLCYRVLSNS